GVALFLSTKNLDALWVRLYLLGEGKSFQHVHNEPNLMIESLRSQGLKIGDFAFYNDVMGPIKIWKANFPSDIKANPDYLERNYPNVNLSIAKRAF
ncbi:MAG: hypothetical protein PHV16_00845, partial [Candidatus Nanoarchaeia archaeon]|nr:hypothetical protein [Candidatus Nanoarchaeia archaeon]